MHIRTSISVVALSPKFCKNSATTLKNKDLRRRAAATAAKTAEKTRKAARYATQCEKNEGRGDQNGVSGNVCRTIPGRSPAKTDASNAQFLPGNRVVSMPMGASAHPGRGTTSVSIDQRAGLSSARSDQQAIRQFQIRHLGARTPRLFDQS
jgi:hypothetical protein